MQSVKLAFFDDHPILLEGLVGLFSDAQDYDVVGKGNTAADVIELSLASGPEVIILDLDMPGNVFEAIKKIRSEKPDIKILIFTASNAIDEAVKALEAGANGYVLKGSTIQDLTSAIQSVIAGDTYITQKFAARVIMALREASLRKQAERQHQWSVREGQIVKLLLKGKTNKEIAGDLAISEKTVKHYMSVLMQKLNARNRIEAVLAVQKLSSGGSAGGQADIHLRH